MSILKFEHLLSPVSLNDFIKQFWGQKLLHVSRGQSSNYFQSILTVDDLSSYLESNTLRYPKIRFVNSKYPGSSVIEENMENKITSEVVIKKLSLGNTLIINSLDKNLPKLQEFAYNIENEFQFRTQSNIYITPPGNQQGLNIHYDTHDVLVLQIHGEKKWNFYEHRAENPTDLSKEKKLHKALDQNKSNQRIASKELILKQGDTLYIPKGLEHAAITTDTTSVHITLSLHPKRWFVLFDYMKELAEEIAVFRSDLPNPLSTTEEKEIFKETFTEHLQDLIAKISVDELLEMSKKSFVIESRSYNKNRFANFVNTEKICLNSIVRKRKNAQHYSEVKDLWYFIYAGKVQLDFPLPLKTIIDWMLTENEYAIKDIPGKGKESLKISLAKKFINIDLIEIVSI